MTLTEKVYKHIDSLEKENNRLREALEFYADFKTYELGVNFSMGSAFPRHEPIKYDKGEIARQTLAGEPSCQSKN